VKIRNEKDGVDTATPDFGVLREGLRMAQRTTPTAIANFSARAMHDHNHSIVHVFAGPMAPDALGPCSFHPGLSDRDRSQR
jgi:hypothetical protein